VQKPARLAICAAFACVLLYFFPLVRIRKLESASTQDSQTQSESRGADGNAIPASDINAFVESLWTQRLPEAAENASTVDDVLALAASDASEAQKRFGRQVGLGGPTFFFLRGRGQIESVNENECRLIIDGRSQRVALEIGILVSNAVRDATGLVSVDDFPNSQDFNQLSTELNKRCESDVIAPIRDQLVVGSTIEFVGCGEVRDGGGFNSLKLIPVHLKTVDTTGTE
jgi:predicted lipoprotein